MSPVKLILLGYRQQYLETGLSPPFSIFTCHWSSQSQYKLDQYTHTLLNILHYSWDKVCFLARYSYPTKYATSASAILGATITTTPSFTR